jgi:hypothetical protein
MIEGKEKMKESNHSIALYLMADVVFQLLDWLSDFSCFTFMASSHCDALKCLTGSVCVSTVKKFKKSLYSLIPHRFELKTRGQERLILNENRPDRAVQRMAFRVTSENDY